MSERGVFAVDRGLFSHPLFADEAFTEREAWLWLISEAAWKPRCKRADGKVIQLGRGQFCHAVRFMAEAWGWSKSRVDRFLDRLEIGTMIVRDHGTRTPVISICNYDRFQRVSLPNGTTTGTTTGTTAGQQRDKLEDIEDIEIGEGDAHARESARPSNRKPELPLPVDWEPSKTVERVASERGYTDEPYRHELATFRDHAVTHDRRCRNWDSAACMWFRKAPEYERRVVSFQAGGNRRPDDSRLAAAQRALGRLRNSAPAAE